MTESLDRKPKSWMNDNHLGAAERGLDNDQSPAITVEAVSNKAERLITSRRWDRSSRVHLAPIQWGKMDSASGHRAGRVDRTTEAPGGRGSWPQERSWGTGSPIRR